MLIETGLPQMLHLLPVMPVEESAGFIEEMEVACVTFFLFGICRLSWAAR